MATNLAELDLAHTPAQAPPPGTVPDFVNPESQGYILIVVIAVCYSLMFPIVALRVYCRNWVNRSFGLDDSELFLQNDETLLRIISCLPSCSGILSSVRAEFSI